MNKLEIGNCLSIIDKFVSLDDELSIWKHGLDLGKLFKPELFTGNEKGTISSNVKIFKGEYSIVSLAYDEIGINDAPNRYYCQLHIDEMVIHNITFELFEYLIKKEMDNYIMLKTIKNG